MNIIKDILWSLVFISVFVVYAEIMIRFILKNFTKIDFIKSLKDDTAEVDSKGNPVSIPAVLAEKQIHSIRMAIYLISGLILIGTFSII